MILGRSFKLIKSGYKSSNYNFKSSFYSTSTAAAAATCLNITQNDYTDSNNIDIIKINIPNIRKLTSSLSTTNTNTNTNTNIEPITKNNINTNTNIEPKGNCWCLLNCGLKGKRIQTSKIKPIIYENSKGWVLGDYNANYETPLTKSRQETISALVKEKDIFILEEKKENEQQLDESLEDDKSEKEETKKLFQSKEELEESNREYPVLNDDSTSLGPVHVLYKNEWVITIVERIELDHKDNEPWFTLKLKTPIRQKDTYDITFNIESVDLIEKLFAFNKSISVDKEFDKLFLTKSSSKPTKKEECKELMESRPFLREALMSLKGHLLPSIGFENSDINLELLRESLVICKAGNKELEFPAGTFQLCLEITSDESIWIKNPEVVEKILFLYTIMLDSIVSTGQTEDSPIDTCYL